MTSLKTDNFWESTHRAYCILSSFCWKIFFGRMVQIQCNIYKNSSFWVNSVVWIRSKFFFDSIAPLLRVHFSSQNHPKSYFQFVPYEVNFHQTFASGRILSRFKRCESFLRTHKVNIIRSYQKFWLWKGRKSWSTYCWGQVCYDQYEKGSDFFCVP